MAPWNISISKGNPMPCISSLSDNFTHGTILDTPRKTYEYWFRKWNEFFFFVPFFFYQNSYRWRKFPKGGRGEENFRLHGKQSKSRGERSKRRKGKEGAKNRGEVNNLLRGRGWNLRLLSRLKFIGEGEVTEPWMRNCNIDRRCAWKLN